MVISREVVLKRNFLCNFIWRYAEFPLSLQRFWFASPNRRAPVVKLVDTPDLGSGASRRVGSSPIRRTFKSKSIDCVKLYSSL